MATTIDSKVVELKFDNRDFEKNTRTSMSTLDKLKSKLSFSGASKGLDEVGRSAKKVDMSGLITGVTTVSNKFSAMEIVGITALANLTTAAMNAGASIVKSLTIDQVASGWSKMNEKVGSVQTLVNSTGLGVKEIDEYLAQLMWFSDETSYSFTDMTAALAQMTSTGGDIKKLVPMITGIANATAFAGKGAAEFSRVIYNLNQSYGGGFLNLMDWKSVQLAGVNSKQLTQELIRAGEELGTIQSKGAVTIGNFNETLKDKWATTEVMELAFGRFSALSEAAYKAVQAGEYDTASEAIEGLAKDFDYLAVASFRSAQEAKSFKEVIDATADATSSSWMRIFEDIFGNYEEQKKIWTNLVNFIYDVFVEPINKIEEVVRHAFNFDGFKNMWEKLTNNSLVKTMDTISEKVKNASKTLEEYQAIVKKVWRGDFNNRGDNPDRFDLLRQAGWDPRVVQSLVNETDRIAGHGKGWTVIDQLTMDDVIKAEAKYGVTVDETTKAVDNQIDSTKELNKDINELTEAQLRKLGLDDEEIRMYQSLQRAAKKYGISMDEIIDKMSKHDARGLLFGKKQYDENGMTVLDDDGEAVYETVGVAQHLANALINIFGAIKKAWSEVFDAFGGAELYMIIDRFNAWSSAVEKATENEKGLQNLTDTFKGLFAILKLISTIMGGGLKIAYTIFKTVLQTLGYDILDVTGALGNFISKVVDFITENEFVIKGVVWLTQKISTAIIKVHDWASGFISLNGALHWLQDTFKKSKEFMSDWIKNMPKDIKEIPRYIFEGLINGIKEYGGSAFEAITTFFSNLIQKARDVLGIHSPSTVFFAIGGFIIAGLIAGLKSQSISLYEFMAGIGNKLIDLFNNLDLTSIFIMASTGGVIYGFIKLSKAFTIFADGLKNFNNIGANVNNLLSTLGKTLKTFKFKIIASSIKDIAIAIAILTGSIIALSFVDPWKIVGSIVAIGMLGGILVTIAAISAKFGAGGKEFAKLALTILAIGVAMSLMAGALKKISKIKDMSLGPILALGALVVGMMAILYVLTKNDKNFVKMAGSILAIGVVFRLMASTVKTLGKMKSQDLKQGLKAIGMFELMIIGLMLSTKLLTGSKNVDKIGGTLLKIMAGIFLMGMVVKSLGRMKENQLSQGLSVITAFSLLIVGLMLSTKLIAGSKNVDKIGKTLMGVGVAFLLMGLCVRLIGGMNPQHLAKGMSAITYFTALIVGLIAATRLASSKTNNIGTTMLGIAAAILAMSVSVALLSLIKTSGLIKGLVAVGMLSLFIIGLAKATENAKDISSTIWAFVGVIGILALAIGLLSIIDPKKLIGPTAALGILMGMTALMIKATEGFSKGGDWKQTLINVGIMIGVIAIMAGVVALLSNINAESALKSCVALALVMAAAAGMLLILGNIKIDFVSLLTGITALMAIIIAMYGIVGVLSLMSGVSNATESAKALSIFMLAMTVALIGIAAAGTIYAATGGLALLGLVGILGIIAALYALMGVLAIMSCIPEASKNISLLTSFMTVMTIMLTALAIVGPLAMVGVVALEALIPLMTALILFAGALGALITYFPIIQQFVDTGMELLILLAAGLGEMVGAFVGGVLTQLSAALPEIANNLSLFMINLQTFLDGARQIDGDVLAGIGILSACILALTVAELVAGVGKLLTFGSGLTGLGKELSAFMIAALPFLTIAATLNDKMMNGVKSLCSAILSLTAANVLEGLANFFGFGSNSLAEFGAQLPMLGTCISQFVSNLGEFTDKQVDTTKCAGDAILALANASSKLPNEGGLWAALAGDNSLASFGKDLPGIATNIAEFVSNLGEFDKPQIQTAKCACEVITALADAAGKIPNTGGLWASLFGDNSLKDFAKDMPSVANGVKGFVDNLGNFKDKTEMVNAATGVIKQLAALGKLDLEKAGKQLPGFGDKASSFAEKMKNFVTKMCEISKADAETASSNTKILVEAANNMMKTISDNIKAKSTDIVSAASEVANKAAKGINSKDVLAELKTQGKNFVQGFADGIKNNTSIATGAGTDLGKAALKAAQKAIDAHSPSREANKLGGYFGEGFVMGIEQYRSRVYDISSSMGNEAKSGLTAAVAKISNMINSDMDTSPTIRPVLDLSNVSDGINSMNGMFGNTSVGVLSNVRAISSNMNSRSQNGNDDVVSAINKLGKNLDNTDRGNVYNINGITYGDDSAISNAVETLIRAVNIERRS